MRYIIILALLSCSKSSIQSQYQSQCFHTAFDDNGHPTRITCVNGPAKEVKVIYRIEPEDNRIPCQRGNEFGNPLINCRKP